MSRRSPATVFAALLSIVLSISTVQPAIAAACSVSQSTQTIAGESYQVVSLTNGGSCTFTIPNGVESIDALLVGGGGGGGGGAGWSAGGSGGGGGGAGGFGLYLDLAVVPGTDISLTVGAGGLKGLGGGSSAPGTDGANGGNSSLVIPGLSPVSEVGGEGGEGGASTGGAGGQSGDGNSGGSPSGRQAGAGGSSGTNGVTGTSVTTGVSSDFSGTASIFSYGGGGGNQTQYGAFSASTPGAGGYGSRGPQSSSGEYVYGYNGSDGAVGQIVLRWRTPSAPDAPTGLTVTQTGEDQALVSWSAPAMTGNTSITGYKVEALRSGSWVVEFSNTGNSLTSAAVGNLARGQVYRFRISAINAIGTSSASAESESIEIYLFLGGEVVPPPVAFRGPQVLSAEGHALKSGAELSLTLFGKRFGKIISASVAGHSLNLTHKDFRGREITLSTSEILTSGTHDVVLLTTHGTLTIVGLVHVDE